MRSRASLFVVLLFAAVACGAPRPPATPSAPAQSDEWPGLTWEERHDTMTFTVLPNLGRLFQRASHADAPSLTCRTCHGQDAEARAYQMPATLPALDAKDPMATASTEKAKVARFMADEVTPTFAELVGDSSVTCFTCHPSRKAGER